MGLLSFFTMSKEERRAASALRKRRRRANKQILELIHSHAMKISDTDCDKIRQLIEDGGDVNTTGWKRGYEGVTLLHAAAMKGCPAVASLLIESGADIDAVAFTGAPGFLRGTTPLIMASESGHVEVVRLLLQAGVDVAKTKVIHYGNSPAVPFTAFDSAKLGGHEETMALLKAYQADD